MNTFLSHFPTPIIEALCAHEAFRRLNFSADEIFIGQTDAGQLLVVLEHRGQKFTIDVVDHERETWEILPDQEFAEVWSSAASVWNTLPPLEASRVYEQSEIRSKAVFLLAKLVQMGLYKAPTT